MESVVGFYVPLQDGVRFMNVDTGEVHVCYDACDRGVDCGDRIVCELTSMVLGRSDPMRPPPRKRRAMERVDVLENRVEKERESRRRIGYDVINEVFPDAPQQKKEEYVERAMAMYDWLSEKIPFDAMLYATLMCASEGVDTPAVSIGKDVDIARHVRPLRYVGKLGIKQNAVTKAYTAIMKKKGPEKIVF